MYCSCKLRANNYLRSKLCVEDSVSDSLIKKLVRKVLCKTLREAMTRLGVIRKATAPSIQSWLPYLLASRLDNYQDLSFNQFSQTTQNWMTLN